LGGQSGEHASIDGDFGEARKDGGELETTTIQGKLKTIQFIKNIFSCNKTSTTFVKNKTKSIAKSADL
jgi:hypothetical protein